MANRMLCARSFGKPGLRVDRHGHAGIGGSQDVRVFIRGQVGDIPPKHPPAELWRSRRIIDIQLPLDHQHHRTGGQHRLCIRVGTSKVGVPDDPAERASTRGRSGPSSGTHRPSRIAVAPGTCPGTWCQIEWSGSQVKMVRFVCSSSHARRCPDPSPSNSSGPSRQVLNRIHAVLVTERTSPTKPGPGGRARVVHPPGCPALRLAGGDRGRGPWRRGWLHGVLGTTSAPLRLGASMAPVHVQDRTETEPRIGRTAPPRSVRDIPRVRRKRPQSSRSG